MSRRTGKPVRYDEMDAIYAEIPPMDCKGLCFESCGPIDMTPLERTRLKERGKEHPGIQLTQGCPTCPLLDFAGRCTVYDIRPMVCRLWGAVESMPCSHGCKPEGGRLSDEKGFELLGRAMKAGGEVTTQELAYALEALQDPSMKRSLQDYVKTGMDKERKRAKERRKR